MPVNINLTLALARTEKNKNRTRLSREIESIRLSHNLILTILTQSWPDIDNIDSVMT